MNLPFPDRRIRVDDFFGKYLPHLWHAATSERPIRGWDVELFIQLRNQQGIKRDYSISLIQGTLQGGPGVPPHPLCTVFTDLSTWRAFLTGVLPLVLRYANDPGNNLRGRISALAGGQSTGALSSPPKGLWGMIEIQYTDDAGEVLVAEVQIGDGAGPRAVVQLGESSLFTLLGTHSPAAALLKSDLRVEGDLGYALKVAQWVESLPSREQN